MKNPSKNNLHGSINELMSHVSYSDCTRQTIINIFRCLLEITIENKSKSIVLTKINVNEDFKGLLNRLKYSGIKTYNYSNLNENEEFLVIIDDTFSSVFFWQKINPEIYKYYISLNQHDALQIINLLQDISFSPELCIDIAEIKYDRRQNIDANNLVNKLILDLDAQQRDLICVDLEIKELNKKSIHSEKLADIGQLCSTIAHEIRTPISMINLYAKIISKLITQNELSSQENIEFLQKAAESISSASLNLNDLLTQLLDYSKPLSIKIIENNLQQAIQETINLITPLYQEKQVKLILNYDLDEEFILKFDKAKLNQVLLNLLKNALESSKKDSTVEMLVNNNLDKDKISIKIKDQGSGIPDNYIDKLFTPYFTTKTYGTGLGLAHSKKIMETMGGDLILVSTGCTGTVFELFFN